MTTRNTLLIFIKHPDPGQVKTRLAKRIGNERAAALYKTCVEIVMNCTQSSEYERVIFFSPHDKKNEITKWLGNEVVYVPQKGRDLGERIADAFRSAFQQGAKKVVVIGTDSLFIDRNIIQKTFKALDHNQCVIGPSEDGGYYLLGIKKLHEGLFKHIAWGTNTVYAQTLRRLKDKKITFAILEKRLDMDTLSDVQKLYTKLKNMSVKDQPVFTPLKEMIEGILDTGT